MESTADTKLMFSPETGLADIGLQIRKLYQKNQALWQTMCIDPQMTSAQHALLNAVHRLGPSSLTEIGRFAAMDPATTRGVVDRLSARGFLEVNSSTTDRRKVVVSLTDASRKHLAEMEAVVPEIALNTLAPLNPAEIIALQYLLDKVASHDGAKPGGDE